MTRLLVYLTHTTSQGFDVEAYISLVKHLYRYTQVNAATLHGNHNLWKYTGSRTTLSVGQSVHWQYDRIQGISTITGQFASNLLWRFVVIFVMWLPQVQLTNPLIYDTISTGYDLLSIKFVTELLLLFHCMFLYFVLRDYVPLSKFNTYCALYKAV